MILTLTVFQALERCWDAVATGRWINRHRMDHEMTVHTAPCSEARTLCEDGCHRIVICSSNGHVRCVDLIRKNDHIPAKKGNGFILAAMRVAFAPGLSGPHPSGLLWKASFLSISPFFTFLPMTGVRAFSTSTRMRSKPSLPSGLRTLFVGRHLA